MTKKEKKQIQNTLNTTYTETIEFLINKDDWSRFDNMPAICDGGLHAVFEMVFDTAPSKDAANELINLRLNHFLKS